MIPIIVGIDPGTTTAISLLDIDGNIIELFSKRNYGLDNAIRYILSKGYPIAIGTDKGKVPWFVGKIANAFKCKVVSPKKDITHLEKKRIVDDFKTKNSHEYDAYASALFAYKKVRNLILKIKKNSPEYLWGVMLRNILNGRFVSIKQGLSIFSDEDEHRDMKNKRKKKISKEVKMIERFRIIEMAYYERIKELEDELRRKEGIDVGERIKHRNDMKVRTISSLVRKVEKLENEIEIIKEKHEKSVSSFRNFLMKLSSLMESGKDIILVPRVNDLGRDSISLLGDADMAYVDNPKNLSPNISIKIIFTRNPTLYIKKKFAVITDKPLLESDDFVVYERKVLGTIDIIDDILKDYRKERSI